MSVELAIVGTGLPRCPVFPGFVTAYRLSPDGPGWGPPVDPDPPAARVRVDARGAWLECGGEGVAVNGVPLAAGSVVLLTEAAEVTVGPRRWRYRPLRSEAYVGMLLGERGDAVRGDTVEVGRNPRAPGVMHPERKTQEGLVFGEAAVAQRARANGWFLDGLAGRVHVSVYGDGRLAEHGRSVTALQHRDADVAEHWAIGSRTLAVGDRLLVGLMVVERLA